MALMLLANLHRAQQAVAEGTGGPSSANDATGIAVSRRACLRLSWLSPGKHVEGMESGRFQ